MSAEGKNTGEKPVDRSERLKLKESEVNKDDESGLLRSTSEMGGKRGMFLNPLALVFTLCLFMISSIQAAPWIIENSDTPDSITEEQIDELEDRAKKGDWELKKEFAAAYLYETSYPEGYGCKRLKYGNRCRAMAKRVESASIFLQEIVDAVPRNESERLYIGSFQKHYARSLRFLGFSDPASRVCREMIHYYELSIKNRQWCAAIELKSMAYWGICMGKSEEKAKAYYDLIPSHVACPNP